MKLKEIPRTATFAWSPDPARPTILTGTAAGTIDAEFSAATELELWPLDLLDHSVAAFTAAPTARVEADARFHDLAVNSAGTHAVGALESGVVEAWTLPDLHSAGRNDAAHTGAVKSVAFHPAEAARFATGGAQGQVFVWDLQNLASPYTPGTAAAQRHDDVESVQWNRIAPHILASGGNRGFASIWDCRRKREVIHLHYTAASGARVPISSVSWHPTNSTRFATASADDNEPVICIWDLKNVNSPERVLRGHTKGVLSIDWCRHDENLLLSGGRDNATLLWNPNSGAQLGTYPISVEWAFKTRFNPRMPDLFASASFDGKISVQSLQDTSTSQQQEQQQQQGSQAQQTQKDGADFWESDTVMDAVHPSFKLQQPPQWLVRPLSATFGFGGKLAIASKNKVSVRSVTDSSLDEGACKKFGEALRTQNFDELASARSHDDRESGWDLLHALLKGEQIPLPPATAVASKAGDANHQNDDDDFDIVPVYAPTTDYKLLGSLHPAVVAAVLAKDYDRAVTELIQRDETADALLVASFGGPDLITRAQNAYLNAHAAARPHLRAAWALATRNPSDLVEHSELMAWPSVLRVVLDDANPEADAEAADAAAAATYKLGRRLVAANERANALKVYLAGKNVGAAASLWLDELPAKERDIAKSGDCTAYVAHVRALQGVVEKLAVATAKLGLPSMTSPGADRLYSAFRDYADVVAQQGDLDLAKLFIDMLPEEYATDKQRVNVATKPEPQQPQKTTVRRLPQVAARPAAAGPSLGGAVPPAAAASPVRTAHPRASARAGAATTAAAAATAASPGGAPAAIHATPTGRYPPNPYAMPGVSPAAASVAASAVPIPPSPSVTAAAAVPPAPAAGSVAAAAAAATPPPPPRASGAAAAAKPFKGWNDIPELPGQQRRAPTAPQRVAAPPRAVPAAPAGPPTSASPSPRGSLSAAAGVAPPPPLSAGAVPSYVAPQHHAAPPPPPAAARPSNPYAPSPGSGPTSRAASVSAKANPYAPSPSSTPPVTQTAPPPPRPGSGAAAPHRARAAPPPTTAAVPPPPPAQPAPAVTPMAAGRIASPAAAVTSPPPPPPPTSSTTQRSAPPAAATSPVQPAAGASEELAHIQEVFSAELERVRAVVETQYAKQYRDAQRRFAIMYSQLAVLSQPLIAELKTLAEALASRDYATAHKSVETIYTTHDGESTDWKPGVKRLVRMSEAVPV